MLTGSRDGRELPDFEGAAAVRHGGRPDLARQRRSSARMATGSGAEGVARRPGAYGGDGVLRRLPRPAGRRGGAWLLWWWWRSAGGAARRTGEEGGRGSGLGRWIYRGAEREFVP
jgi:hypothetical protein